MHFEMINDLVRCRKTNNLSQKKPAKQKHLKSLKGNIDALKKINQN